MVERRLTMSLLITLCKGSELSFRSQREGKQSYMSSAFLSSQDEREHFSA